MPNIIRVLEALGLACDDALQPGVRVLQEAGRAHAHQRQHQRARVLEQRPCMPAKSRLCTLMQLDSPGLQATEATRSFSGQRKAPIPHLIL